MPKRTTSTGSLVNPYDMTKFKDQKISKYKPNPNTYRYDGPPNDIKKKLNENYDRTLNELNKNKKKNK